MKKIFFAPNQSGSSLLFEKDFSCQTPNNKGIWDQICSTSKVDEAHYLIIQDYTTDKELLKKFEKKKNYLF